MPGIVRKVKPGNRLRAATEAAIFGAVLGQRLLVVSDAHLGRGTSETEEAFLAFLAAAPSLGDCLLINGDLFEFWFTYKRVVPRAGFRVAAGLAELRRRIPVVMTGGNHDRWGGTFWQKELGIEFSPSEVRLGIGRRVVLALHGDGVTETRPSARWLHRVTRHPLAIAGFRSLHPDVGHWLVDHLSASLGNSEPDPAARPTRPASSSAGRRHASKAIRVLGRSSSATLTRRCFQSLSRGVTISIREHGLMDTATLSSATSVPN